MIGSLYAIIAKVSSAAWLSVLVVGFYKVQNEYIGKDAGFLVGDKIVSINNQKVTTIDEMVNITDKVELMGENITLGQISRFANKSIHEMLLNIGKNNQRIYIKNNTIEFISKK